MSPETAEPNRQMEQNGARAPASFDAEKLLRNPVRRRIFEAACTRPYRLRELCDIAGVGTAAMYHHLEKMAAAGMIRRKRVGRAVVVSASSSHASAPPVQFSKPARAMAEAVFRNPGATQAELAQRVDCSSRMAGYHLRRLEAQGLIEMRKEDFLRAWPRPQLREALFSARITSN